MGVFLTEVMGVVIVIAIVVAIVFAIVIVFGCRREWGWFCASHNYDSLHGTHRNGHENGDDCVDCKENDADDQDDRTWHLHGH